MRKFTSFLMSLMLLSSLFTMADETITVTANSTDISDGLDLKVVANLFAEAKNLEEFETRLNDPKEGLCNLDLNGDGEVDYIRVVEVGEGSSRLVILQAVLAKDIFQDIASILVEKDSATSEVSVQIVGDEYIYGAGYIIEPVYVYRPYLYDYFWDAHWYAWHSPYYWGYYPSWWYCHSVWAYDAYWAHCYAFHHHHMHCSYHYAHAVRPAFHHMGHGSSRRDYATVHPNGGFSRRQQGMSNAREMQTRRAITSGTTRTAVAQQGQRGPVSSDATRRTNTFGSQHVATTTTRNSAATTASRPATTTTTRSSAATTTTRPATSSTTRSSGSYSSSTTTRSSSSSTNSRPATSSSTRSSAGSYSGSSTRSSAGSYSGSSTRSSAGSYSGGSHSSGGGASRPASGGGSRR